MKYIIPLLISTTLSLFGEGSFITPMEYASQLYDNPRGIGCGKCHGKHGEGLVIAHYTHKEQEKTFSAPPINKLSYEAFYKALHQRKKGMPLYYLTQGEIQALYLYLQNQEFNQR